MLRHVVLFRWKPETLPEKIREIEAAFCALPSEIHQIIEFEWGTEEKLRHIPGQSRGDITHFYAYAQLKDGGVQFDVLTKFDVDGIMTKTQSKGNYGPWKDHYEQMGRKTMVRRLFNYLPVSIEMAEAASLDSKAEGGMEQSMDEVLTGEYTVMPQEDAPQIEQQQGQEEEDPPVVDENGEIFDANLHASDSDGLPIFNKDGSFRKKPTRRAAAQKPAAAQPQEPEPEQTEDPAPQEQDGDFFGDGEEENFEIE